MLLVTSALPHAGKTRVALAALRQAAGAGGVQAVRVSGPRGDGAADAAGDVAPADDVRPLFCLAEEVSRHGPRDSCQFLAAGAARAFSLRAGPDGVAAALQTLAEALDPALPVVCESDAPLPGVSPGLSVSLTPPGTAAAPADLRFDAEWPADPDPTADNPAAALTFREGAWTLRRPATVVVLAGGRSSRMGVDKALVPFQGKPLVAHVVDAVRPHFDEVLVATGAPERFAFLGVDIVRDRVCDEGPMMAVASALARATYETVFVLPCDVPRFPAALLRDVLRRARGEADIVVPVHPDTGHLEPLFAVYRRRVLPLLDRALAVGVRKILLVYDACRTERVPIAPGMRLTNVNTPDDLAALDGPPTAIPEPPAW